MERRAESLPRAAPSEPNNISPTPYWSEGREEETEKRRKIYKEERGIKEAA